MQYNVIVCEPNRQSIDKANTNLDKYLFRDEVNYEKAKKQHDYLIEILKIFNVNVIILNDLLPKDTPIKEMANLLFTRDTFIRTPKGIIIGRMKKDIRKYECEIIEQLFQSLNKPILYRMQDPETLEGGDYACKNDITFIAVGTRTNHNAVYRLMEEDLLGTHKIAVIECEQPDTDMHRIHLDCYFAPFGRNYCLLWEELLKMKTPYQRIVTEYVLYTNGLYYPTGVKEPLFNYLIHNNFNVIPITTRSHYNYGCNILELTNEVVIVQDEESHKKIKNSVLVPFDEIHRMYGGIHCATNMI